MLKCLLCLLVCVTSFGSPPQNAHSSGCGSTITPSSGKVTMTNQGHTREYWVHIPQEYSTDVPTPLVMLFHGWGYSGKEWYGGGGAGTRPASSTADKYGFLLVAPTGLSDSRFPGNCDTGNGYCSWNGGGTTGSPGPEGKTCSSKQQQDLCYHGTCADGCKDLCWWTTCNDDTTFVHALLDKIEAEFCIDRTRIYAGGESNGGVMTWQMGTDSRAARFAAFVPVIGLPHHGFDYLPAHLPLPIMGVWGSTDRTIPHGGNTRYSTSKGGWYYTTADWITKQWANAHGCDTTRKQSVYKTTATGSGLVCKTWEQDCSSAVSSAPVVDCRFQGGHVVKPFVPELMWEFFSKHTRVLESDPVESPVVATSTVQTVEHA